MLEFGIGVAKIAEALTVGAVHAHPPRYLYGCGSPTKLDVSFQLN